MSTRQGIDANRANSRGRAQYATLYNSIVAEFKPAVVPHRKYD